MKRFCGIVRGLTGLLWIVQSIQGMIVALTPLPAGARSDVEPWLVILLCVVWFGAALLCLLGALAFLTKEKL